MNISQLESTNLQMNKIIKIAPEEFCRVLKCTLSLNTDGQNQVQIIMQVICFFFFINLQLKYV